MLAAAAAAAAAAAGSRPPTAASSSSLGAGWWMTSSLGAPRALLGFCRGLAGATRCQPPPWARARRGLYDPPPPPLLPPLAILPPLPLPPPPVPLPAPSASSASPPSAAITRQPMTSGAMAKASM
jgi:hypothetical protein